MSYSERYTISGPSGSLPVIPATGGSMPLTQYPTPTSPNSIQNFLANPALQAALFTGGGGALGSALAGPWGGAIGAGAAPIVQSLLTPQQEPWGQVLTEAGLAALGGGLGTAVIHNPLGGALGAGAGGYLGYQLAQHPGGIGNLFGAHPQAVYDGAIPSPCPTCGRY